MAPEDIPVIEFLPAPAVQEAEPSPYALSYQGEWWWVPAGPVALLDPIADVVIQADRPEVYALVTRSGQVWVSPDSGVSWRQGLAGNLASTTTTLDPNQGEDVVSDVNIDTAGDPDFYSSEGDLNDASGQVQQAIDDAAEAREERETQAAILAVPHRPRVWFDGEVLYVGRSDGLHRTADLGQSWDRVLRERVSAFLVAGGQRFAGTTSGIRISSDGRYWEDRDDGTKGLSVLALADSGEGLFAGTTLGLWYSPDGVFWYRRYTFDEPVLSVTADPDISERLWVSLPRTILSSDTNGTSFDEPLTAPMPSVTKMLHLGPLHWVASSADGPWETMNGGLSWVPIARGLGDPDTPGIDAVQGRLLLASSEGVFRMERAPDLLFDPDAQAEILRHELSSWIPRGALVESALGRVGLNERKGGSRITQTLLPRVTTYVWYRVSDGVDFNSGLGEEFLLNADSGTIRPYDRLWRFSMELRWSPPGRKASGDFGGSDFDVAGADFGVDLTTMNDSGGHHADRRVAQYRTQLARHINEIYTTRAEAMQRRPAVARAPMLQQVQLELFIAELEAELDALTDGAVSAWQQNDQ